MTRPFYSLVTKRCIKRKWEGRLGSALPFFVVFEDRVGLLLGSFLPFFSGTRTTLLAATTPLLATALLGTAGRRRCWGRRWLFASATRTQSAQAQKDKDQTNSSQHGFDLLHTGGHPFSGRLPDTWRGALTPAVDDTSRQVAEPEAKTRRMWKRSPFRGNILAFGRLP